MSNKQQLDALKETYARLHKEVGQSKETVNELETKFDDGIETKANEVANTQHGPYAANTVPQNVVQELNSNLIVEQSALAPFFTEGNQGSGLEVSERFPVEGRTDTLFHSNSEQTTGNLDYNTDGRTTFKTDKVDVVQRDFISKIDLSKRLLNYSVTDFVSVVNRKLADRAANTVDAYILNADPETTGSNINHFGGSASFSDIYYLSGDNGLRKTANDDGNTFDIGTISSTGSEFIDMTEQLINEQMSYGAQLDDLLFVVDNFTYKQLLKNINDVRTRDKFGPMATIEQGQLTKIYGIDIVPSDYLKKADSNGFVNANTANNTKGQVVLVYKPTVIHGFGQEMTLETVRIPGKGLRIVANFEFGFGLTYKLSGTPATVSHGINVDLS